MSIVEKPEPAILPRSQICLFLDIDGTLVEFADTPEAVRVDAQLIGTLRALHAALGGALAIVSGRALGDIDRLFAPLQIPAAGLHGAERRDAAGSIHASVAPGSGLDAVRGPLQAFAAAHPGVLIEDKSGAIAVHYRAVPRLQEALQEALSELVSPYAGTLTVLPGVLVYEIKSAQTSKGSAVEAYMREEPFRSRLPVFVGDDITDYYGFGAVRDHGGITIAVGHAVRAQWYLPDPAATRRWLRRVAEADAARV